MVDCSPHMQIRAGFAPHAVSVWERLMQIYGTKISATSTCIGESRVGSIEQQIEMVKSKAFDNLVRQPHLVSYMTFWQYVHGFAFFQVRTPAIPCMDQFQYRSTIPCMDVLQYRSKIHRIAKRRR